METNGFEQFSELWKKDGENNTSKKLYSEKEIKRMKMKKSLDFSKSINNSIIFDFILKGVLVLGMLLLVWFYKTDVELLITLSGLIGLSLFFIYMEFNIRSKLHKIEDYTKELSEVLKEKIVFYKSNFTYLKLMIAFTNALLVWIGSMFYFHTKYGYYRIEDLADGIVAILMISLAFGISYTALGWQMKNNVLELEESLQNLEDAEATSFQLQLQAKRKKRQKILIIVIAAVGIIIFSLLMINYLILL